MEKIENMIYDNNNIHNIGEFDTNYTIYYLSYCSFSEMVIKHKLYTIIELCLILLAISTHTVNKINS